MLPLAVFLVGITINGGINESSKSQVKPIFSLKEGKSVFRIDGESDETLPPGSSLYAIIWHTSLKRSRHMKMLDIA